MIKEEVACPEGWHLPTSLDWRNLTDCFSGREITAGAPMRSNRKFYHSNDVSKAVEWGENDAANTSFSGFNALPSGSIYADEGASDFGSDSKFLVQDLTSSHWLIINYYSSIILIGGDVQNYFSVRCVKDPN